MSKQILRTSSLFPRFAVIWLSTEDHLVAGYSVWLWIVYEVLSLCYQLYFEVEESLLVRGGSKLKFYYFQETKTVAKRTINSRISRMGTLFCVKNVSLNFKYYTSKILLLKLARKIVSFLVPKMAMFRYGMAPSWKTISSCRP